MAAANISGNENQKIYEQVVCSAGLYAGIRGQLTFISTLNIFLSITAFLGNTLILAALRKESSLHPPSKLLLRSLATTDLCVGLISQPLAVSIWLSVVNKKWNICRWILAARFITDYILCGVSLCTVTAISVDRLLALLLGPRYRQVVTFKRTFALIINFWVVSTVFSTIYFLNAEIIKWYSIIGILFCLITSIFSYTKIFSNLRHHQNQVQGGRSQQPNQANQLNIARYRKALSSALWLQVTLVACYLPFFIVTTLAANVVLSSSLYLAWRYTNTIVFLNSSLNPILYCWKIDEVRQAVKDTIRQVLCCLSS